MIRKGKNENRECGEKMKTEMLFATNNLSTKNKNSTMFAVFPPKTTFMVFFFFYISLGKKMFFHIKMMFIIVFFF
jgi:hypothetical protein